MAYKVKLPFTVATKLQIPHYEYVKGVKKKVYPALEECPDFFGSFRTFGGTEVTSNGVLVVENTAVINCWYDPQIDATARIYVVETDKYYDVIGTPEDIEMRHQYLQFKVKNVTGGA